MDGEALIVVDVQNDFCPNGALAVPEGDIIIPVINRLIEKFRESNLPVFTTQDWHPANHCNFKKYGGIWPVHCVQDTKGAELHPELKITPDIVRIYKGTSPHKEAYSGFDGTDLDKKLKELNVSKIFVCGLATDYCVKNTVLDGIKNGFEVFVVTDAIKGVDVNPGDSRLALDEMQKKGAVLVDSTSIKI